MGTSAEEFRGLVEKHQRMVFSIALRLTGDAGLAEEVAQDAFLALFQCGDRSRPGTDDHVRFWLRRVTVHRATDALRRRSRRPESNAEEWTTERHDVPVALPSGGAGGGDAAERIESLLQTLPDETRIAVVLRYQEDMSPEEIAALVEQPVATVKSHLQRGLQLLRRKAAVTMKEYIR